MFIQSRGISGVVSTGRTYGACIEL